MAAPRVTLASAAICAFLLIVGCSGEPTPEPTTPPPSTIAVTPTSQAPLDQYPDSVTDPVQGVCSGFRYSALLTRPYDTAQMVAQIDETIGGSLSTNDFTKFGIALADFDYIDARALFGDRSLRVNTTLIVTMLCD